MCKRIKPLTRLNMNYKKVYEDLINRAKERKDLETYFEIHHIIPKSVGGSNDEDNLVKLTLREHYLAHELLVFIYPESKELKYALWMMTTSTIAAENEFKNGAKNIKGRVKHFLETNTKKIRISSYEYDLFRRDISSLKKMKRYSADERKNVSEGTRKAMRNPDIIKKCISGSKGCHYYHDKVTQKVYKWFPGDDDIDLDKYEWGRAPMTAEQKKKISDLSNMKKRYFIIPEINAKYTMYEDYLNCVPCHWEEKWTNKSNRNLRNNLISAIRKVNILTSFKYENELIIKDSNKSKNFKIISPSIYEHCTDSMEGWENEDVSDKISKNIILNIDKIINSNKIYIKAKNND